ncbi:MAG TPA: hypothetical protein VG297_14040 [Bryobacteraceae bacterium]|nr:hypothetical protein [Bryobacteraceae bacterium]
MCSSDDFNAPGLLRNRFAVLLNDQSGLAAEHPNCEQDLDCLKASSEPSPVAKPPRSLPFASSTTIPEIGPGRRRGPVYHQVRQRRAEDDAVDTLLVHDGQLPDAQHIHV